MVAIVALKFAMSSHFPLPKNSLSLFWPSQMVRATATSDRKPNPRQNPAQSYTVIAEIFVRVKISYSSVCQLSYVRNFRTATVVSDTLVYVYGFRMLLNFVLSAKSTKYTKLNRVRKFVRLHYCSSHRKNERLPDLCFAICRFFSDKVYHPEPPHAQSLFLFLIVSGINNSYS